MHPELTPVFALVHPLHFSFCVMLLGAAVLPAPALAQVSPVVHFEAGGATMLSSHQRDVLGFDHGFGGSVRPGLRIADIFGIEIGAGVLWFPSSTGLGRVFLAGGGLRFEPMIGGVARLVFDGHAHFAYTGDLPRFAADGGLALELQAGDLVGIGPYARYTHVFASGQSDGADAMMISYGLSVSIGAARDRPDGDGDGVADDDDLCIDVHAGVTADRHRPGCPVDDVDRDGVHDGDDLCVRIPAGDRPDLDRAGCPFTDSDSDGAQDRADLCPTVPMGARPDPARIGCPIGDSDGDGTDDTADACISTIAGAHPDPARPGCPDGDDDGDGVRNGLDVCRTEHRHATLWPDPARLGCPLADRDHDTVPDASDACPDQPGAADRVARRSGCPGVLVVYRDHIAIDEPVFFATGQDRILPRSRRVLRALAEALRLTPGIERLSIEGHTDDVGTDEANRQLAERRAASVLRWLVDHDVDPARLESRGMGESDPSADGTSSEARDENRRVEFRIVPIASLTVAGDPS